MQEHLCSIVSWILSSLNPQLSAMVYVALVMDSGPRKVDEAKVDTPNVVESSSRWIQALEAREG